MAGLVGGAQHGDGAFHAGAGSEEVAEFALHGGFGGGRSEGKQAGVVGFGAFGIACLIEVVPHPIEAGAHLQERQIPLAGRGTGTRRIVLHEAVEQHAQRL